jgi:hypothetical protein
MVGASVGASVGAKMGASVGAMVGASIGAVVGATVDSGVAWGAQDDSSNVVAIRLIKSKRKVFISTPFSKIIFFMKVNGNPNRNCDMQHLLYPFAIWA